LTVADEVRRQIAAYRAAITWPTPNGHESRFYNLQQLLHSRQTMDDYDYLPSAILNTSLYTIKSSAVEFSRPGMVL
jgi:hypothetical protein